MGIRGFFKYVTELSGSFKEVNLVDEIKKYKNEQKRNPLIVINLWTLSFHYKAELKEKLLGHDLNKVREDFKNFLSTLQKNGAELVFLFKKTQIKEHEFIKNQEKGYATSCGILDALSTGKSFVDVVKRFEQIDRKDYPVNDRLLMVLTQTAAEYGKLFGMDSNSESKPATFHVFLANHHNAMAILGTDTYYFFYGGEWKFWDSTTLDIKRMTVREYNKELVLQTLGFVALAGGLYTEREADVAKITEFFKPYRRLFPKVSTFVNQQSFPISDDAIKNIVSCILSKHKSCDKLKIAEDFRRTMELMTPRLLDFKNRITDTHDNRRLNDYMNFAEFILNKEAIYISPHFVDLRKQDMPPLIDIVSPWIQKTAGLLNQDKSEDSVKVLFKERHYATMAEKELKTVAPKPGLDINDKIEMLIWITDTKLEASVLCKMPLNNLVIATLLEKLVEQNYLKRFECVLITNALRTGAPSEDSLYPTNVSERALRVSFLFSKLFYILHSCLSSIGLDFERVFQFDNILFLKLYELEDREKDDDANKAIASFEDLHIKD